MKTVKAKVRPSVYYEIATDWSIGRCLKRCLMYSRASPKGQGSIWKAIASKTSIEYKYVTV
jgi:hypothetical protein